MRDAKFWIATISKDHIRRGIEGSFIQVCHGKAGPLKRMKKGDYIIVYSSRLSVNGKEKCQAFTAVGQIENDQVYQVEMAESFKPFRREVVFFHSSELSILPLIEQLDFIGNKKFWGYPFRFGLFEIQEKDFNLITQRMVKDEINR